MFSPNLPPSAPVPAINTFWTRTAGFRTCHYSLFCMKRSETSMIWESYSKCHLLKQPKEKRKLKVLFKMNLSNRSQINWRIEGKGRNWRTKSFLTVTKWQYTEAKRCIHIIQAASTLTLLLISLSSPLWNSQLPFIIYYNYLQNGKLIQKRHLLVTGKWEQKQLLSF